MKKYFLLFFFFLVSFSLVFSQSLVEAAKKERERRKKIKKKVPVITNENIGKIKKGKGYGYIISSARSSDFSTSVPEISDKQNYEDWHRRYLRILKEIEEMEKIFKSEKKKLDDLIFRFKITNNPNEKFSLPAKISKQEKEVAKLNEKLKKLRKKLEDFKEEARQAGVPPGYLR